MSERIKILASESIQQGSFAVYDKDIGEKTEVEFDSEELIFFGEDMAGDLFGLAILKTLANPVILVNPIDI